MRTSFSLATLVRASLVTMAMAASSAHAVEVTIDRGIATVVDGIVYTLNPANTSQWEFGFFGAGVMSVLQAELSSTGGAVLTTTPGQKNDKYASITLSMPVSTVTGDSMLLGGERYFDTKGYTHDGCITITVPKEVGGRKNAAALDGGSLTINNLEVDLVRLRVWADMSTPTSTPSRVPLWDIITHTSGGMGVTGPNAEVGAIANIASFRLSNIGFAAMSSGLGLSTMGNAALASATSFGTITTAVPEPSAWAMTLIGALGACAVARRRKATH